MNNQEPDFNQFLESMTSNSDFSNLMSNLTKNMSNINTDELKERVDNMETELEKLKSSLNISNNRAEYESMIIYLDDIIAYTMLKDVSQMKLDQSVNKLAGNLSDLNKLQESRKTLNELITWLDKN